MDDLSWGAIVGWTIAGIMAVWAVVSELLPRAFDTWTKAKLKVQDSKIEADADTRDFQQQTTGAAINNSILLNEMAFKALVDTIDRYDKSHDRDFGRIDARMTEVERRMGDWVTDVNKTLDKIAVHIARSSTGIEISNRERAQLEEVLSDVDSMFHEIRGFYTGSHRRTRSDGLPDSNED